MHDPDKHGWFKDGGRVMHESRDPYMELTCEQLTYDPKSDLKRSVAIGLRDLLYDGWVLVTSYPSTNYYTGQVGTTMFVFRNGA